MRTSTSNRDHWQEWLASDEGATGPGHLDEQGRLEQD
jgi:hypothetical protein